MERDTQKQRILGYKHIKISQIVDQDLTKYLHDRKTDRTSTKLTENQMTIVPTFTTEGLIKEDQSHLIQERINQPKVSTTNSQSREMQTRENQKHIFQQLYKTQIV